MVLGITYWQGPGRSSSRSTGRCVNRGGEGGGGGGGGGSRGSERGIYFYAVRYASATIIIFWPSDDVRHELPPQKRKTKGEFTFGYSYCFSHGTGYHILARTGSVLLAIEGAPLHEEG